MGLCPAPSGPLPLRTLLALPLALLWCLAPDPAQAKCREGQCWGAIAYSRLTGYWVYSMNHPDRRAARSRAWRMCNRRCTDVATVKNGCLALFVTPRGRHTLAQGPSSEAATEAARTQCESRYKKCGFRVARCTADFGELKRRAREKARQRPEKRPHIAPERAPPAAIEELKL